jgi:hypothetical protein
MGSIGAVFAIFLLIAFLGGIFIGVIMIASLASRREDDLHSLTGEAPGPVCEGIRRLTGAHTRGGGFLSSAMRSDDDPRTSPDGGEDDGEDDGEDAPGQEPVR